MISAWRRNAVDARITTVITINAISVLSRRGSREPRQNILDVHAADAFANGKCHSPPINADSLDEMGKSIRERILPLPRLLFSILYRQLPIDLPAIVGEPSRSRGNGMATRCSGQKARHDYASSETYSFRTIRRTTTTVYRPRTDRSRRGRRGGGERRGEGPTMHRRHVANRGRFRPHTCIHV